MPEFMRDEQVVRRWCLLVSVGGEVRGLVVRCPESHASRIVRYLDDSSGYIAYPSRALRRDEFAITLPPCRLVDDLYFFVATIAMRAKEVCTIIEKAMSTQPASIVGSPQSGDRKLSAAEARLLAQLRNLGVVCKRVFVHAGDFWIRGPDCVTSSDFMYEADEAMNINDDTSLWIGDYRHTDRDQTIERMRILAAEKPQSFDSNDFAHFRDELDLAVLSSRHATPLATIRGKVYASSEYWIGSVVGKAHLLPYAFVGLLTFYGTGDEIWIGYLSKPGRIMMDIALRRAAGRGYSLVYVWTTPSNEPALRCYRNAGFEESGPAPHDISSVDEEHITFECVAYEAGR